MVKPLLLALVRLISLGLLAKKENKRRDIKNDPIGAFDGKFNRLHDDKKPVQQADSGQDAK